MFGSLFKKEKGRPKPKTLMGVLGIFYYSGTYPKLPKIVCADGFKLSIQYDLLCNRNFYSLELGMLSSYEPLLDQYAEEPGKCDTIFGYVPITLVRHIVEDLHGGIIGWEDRKKVDIYNSSDGRCIPNRDIILPYKYRDCPGYELSYRC